jgi:excisionase family DNA binding protein
MYISRNAQQQDERNVNALALLRAADVAALLGISIKTVHKLVRERKLASVQVTPRERRFTREQVQEYIESQSTGIRVDKKPTPTVSSRPRKGGEHRKRGEKTGVSKACQLDQLKEEMRQW